MTGGGPGCLGGPASIVIPDRPGAGRLRMPGIDAHLVWLWSLIGWLQAVVLVLLAAALIKYLFFR
jgi:hypothetical protein